ncbi:hypothetical protein LMB98_09260 [Limosilactobacillus reuteri]|uniref:hypothetical protein n=1 Tax=Limosilactobacillus reuteri TaxID=1598 RepID=UPI001E5A3263|nr:hypothetical protein [Limosilactobacillus reuteri]MCC4398206.1 hypothetical protein [Limosilactobacillus reuteri]MCC4409788.1 hypothetical protein [Limosilactobacillus reuteri]
MQEYLKFLIQNVERWFNSLDWGSVPDWFSAIGTTGAFIWGVSTVLHNRKPHYRFELRLVKEKSRNETRIRISFLNMDQAKHGIQEIGCAYSENLLSRKKNMNLSPAKTIDMYRENFYLEPWKLYVTNWENDAVFYNMNFKRKRALLRPYLIDYSGQIYFGKRKIVSTQEINNPFPQP